MKKVLLTLIVSLALCGPIFAQPESHWADFNHYAYEMHGALVASVSIDGNIMELSEENSIYVEPESMPPYYISYDYEVGAFVNGVCRGHGFLYYYPGHPYTTTNQMGIYYNPIMSDTYKEVTFKLYDHVNLIEYTICTSSPQVLTGCDYVSYDPETNLPHNYYQDPVSLNFSSSFTKPIDQYTTNGGWYLIASPIGEVSPADVTNMTSNNSEGYIYDLYQFNQSADLEWENWKEEGSEHYHFNLLPGTGYLYANSTGDDITFIGAPYNGTGEVSLAYDEHAVLKGWNLVGNPFADTAYIDRPFYVMNPNGTEIIAAEDVQQSSIAPMEGVFVVAAGANEKVTFSTVEPNTSKGQIVLNVTQNQGDVIDRAIVCFGQGGMLPKFMLNQNNTKLYITKDNKDFAVMSTNNSGRLLVNFEPAEDGVYFINASVENLVSVRYLHLIDHQEALDIDLLQEPIYKFDANKNGNPNRFELVFKKLSSQTNAASSRSDGDSFGFCNNGKWIIDNEGDAVLQVIDVNGRILCNEEINGSVSKRIDAAPGVYMLRLINNNDVKVQKIVVE